MLCEMMRYLEVGEGHTYTRVQAEQLLHLSILPGHLTSIYGSPVNQYWGVIDSVCLHAWPCSRRYFFEPSNMQSPTPSQRRSMITHSLFPTTPPPELAPVGQAHSIYSQKHPFLADLSIPQKQPHTNRPRQVTTPNPTTPLPTQANTKKPYPPILQIPHGPQHTPAKRSFGSPQSR